MKNKSNKMGIGKGRHPPTLDYAIYSFSKKELTMYVFLESVFIGMIAYLFYDSVFAFLLLLPFALLSLKEKGNSFAEKENKSLRRSFVMSY